MAHNLDISKEGKAAFAFTGSRDAIWHKLGSQLTTNAPLETWIEEAGMNWEVKESDVAYLDKSVESDSQVRVFPNKKVLYRSDTGNPLSIMSNDYHVVQPKEVIEFFRDLTEQHGMVLSTAGCLFNGSRFWALAETGKSFSPFSGDETKCFVLFVTSVDGSLSNIAKVIATRVVCNNTLSIALNEKSNNIIRKTHRSVWDATQVKMDMDLLSNSWDVFVNKLKKLSNRKMTELEVSSFFKSTFFDPKAEEQTNAVIKKVDSLMTLYRSGAGAEYDYGTAAGVLNAATNLFTHGTGRAKNPDRRFISAYFDSDKEKSLVFNNLLEIC